eukprot:14324765-Heterocapsa_arctica.AAC.1
MFGPNMRRQRLTSSKMWARLKTETATEAVHHLHRGTVSLSIKGRTDNEEQVNKHVPPARTGHLP